MQKVIVLNVVFSSSLKEKHSDKYVYSAESFLEKVVGSDEIARLRTKYAVVEEYTWHFLNNEKLQEFLNMELTEYYGKMTLCTLSGYIVRSLNYRHTGISIRNFIKRMIYIGTDNNEYICLAGTYIYDSQWLQMEVLKEYRVNSLKENVFLIPKGTVFEVMDWMQIETELVNVTAKAELQDYKIEESKVVFE